MSELPNRVESRKEAGSAMDIKVAQANEAGPPVCLGPDHLKGFSAPPSARNLRLRLESHRSQKAVDKGPSLLPSLIWSLVALPPICSLRSNPRNFPLEIHSGMRPCIIRYDTKSKHEQHKRN